VLGDRREFPHETLAVVLRTARESVFVGEESTDWGTHDEGYCQWRRGSDEQARGGGCCKGASGCSDLPRPELHGVVRRSTSAETGVGLVVHAEQPRQVATDASGERPEGLVEGALEHPLRGGVTGPARDEGGSPIQQGDAPEPAEI
jgi:hypothetical protein